MKFPVAVACSSASKGEELEVTVNMSGKIKIVARTRINAGDFLGLNSKGQLVSVDSAPEGYLKTGEEWYI